MKTVDRPELAIREVFGESTSPLGSDILEYGWIVEGIIAYELAQGDYDGAVERGYFERSYEQVRVLTVVRNHETRPDKEDDWKRYHKLCEVFWGNEYDHIDDEVEMHIEKLKRKGGDLVT